MILVLAGTQDGREIAEDLTKEYPGKVLVSVVSEYGGILAEQTGLHVRVGALNEIEFHQLCEIENIQFCIDASHPYAKNVTAMAQKVCSELQISYIRYERPKQPLPEYDQLILVSSPSEAARICGLRKQKAFLTTGSRSLADFTSEPSLPIENLVVRVLPDPQVLQQCLDLGLLPRQMIAMQGPFSHELNKAMLQQSQAEVMVTKNSGALGGTDTKLTAAIELGLTIIMIDRPKNVEGPFVTTKEKLKTYLQSLRRGEINGNNEST